MPRNPLNDVVNTLPHMVAGRLDRHDFEALADLPDGILTIDLLARTVQHGSGAAPAISATGLLADWFDGRLQAAQFDRSGLTKAAITVAIRTDRVAVDRSRIVPFDLRCTAEIAAGGRTWVSKPAPALRWYRRHDGMVTD
jgi:hypothetical protein